MREGLGSLAEVSRSLSSAALICAKTLIRGHWSVKRTRSGTGWNGRHEGIPQLQTCPGTGGGGVLGKGAASCSLSSLLPLAIKPPWDSLVAQMVKKKFCLQCGRPGFHPWVWKIPWRKEWQPTPVFLPGEFHGQRSQAGYSPWGRKESDKTERLTLDSHRGQALWMGVFSLTSHNGGSCRDSYSGSAFTRAPAGPSVLLVLPQRGLPNSVCSKLGL